MDNIVNWIFGIVGVIGTLLTVISYVQTRWLKKIPMYALLKAESIDKNDLNISVNGEIVSNLVVSYLVFWNNGGVAITNEDYSVNKLPCIQCEDGGKILSYKVVDVFDKDFVNLRTRPNDIKIDVKFDKIGRKQGFVIRVIHTKRVTFLVKLNDTQVKSYDAATNQIPYVIMLWFTAFALGIVTSVVDNVLVVEFKSLLFLFYGSLLFFVTNRIIRRIVYPIGKIPKHFRKYIRNSK